MEYPKAVMRMSELKKMGMTAEWLLAIYRQRNQKIAWKAGTAVNSPILFDTKALESYRQAMCAGGRGRDL